MKLEMQMKIMREIESNVKNINTEVQKANKKYEKANQQIKNIVSQQD